jgi:quinol monooxygenase YgiN
MLSVGHLNGVPGGVSTLRSKCIHRGPDPLDATPAITARRSNAVPQLQVIARHRIAAGNEEAVWAVLPEFIEAARTEPGNIEFAAFRSLEDPRSYALLERYASQAAFDAHRDTGHFKKLLLGTIAPLLESRSVEQYDVAEPANTIAR